jgi:alanyl-tRNA synthetase/REP element-mobilizing transposase RayT
MLTSAQIRQSFLDFFREKQHTIVPSSSLLPDSPNLLFTNAGMNQFVPIFLGERSADVSKWAGAVPALDTRAADTQKCIRAGGKHNDLDDVGLDTYHHTFFEMLGNWSFGDYFKKDAIAWAWELIVERWKFPAERLYATIYQPDPGDPAERDEEAWSFWAEKFRAAGLDPAIHIVNGNKKDNFWMMGDTGPCGPCSELHVDLTPHGDTKGALVNQGSAECIEIWNLVFIQFNANADGTFSPLPAQHVDTGMGFERVTSILQCTKGFTTFTETISNYETDIFRPIFDELEKMSGKRYTSTLPAAPNSVKSIGSSDKSVASKGPSNASNAQSEGSIPSSKDSIPSSEGSTDKSEASSVSSAASSESQIAIDVAFRVIADHIRTLSFAIADGIQPGNTDRNYVLRRILRRAVRYGRTLGFKEPFFYKLVAVLADKMGGVFPELRAKQKHVEEVLKREEEAFNKTLDKGIALFEAEAAGSARVSRVVSGVPPGTSSPTATGAKFPTSGTRYSKRRLPHFERPWAKYLITFSTQERRPLSPTARTITLDAIRHFHGKRYELFAAVVMPDHVHILFEPGIKTDNAEGQPVFWALSDLMHSIKSFTAHKIQDHEGGASVWEKEWHDRMIRSEADLEEKFSYVVGNPWRTSIVGETEDYAWVWYPGKDGVSGDEGSRRDAENDTRDACATQAAAPLISAAFAFRLYDEQGFPLDLTELMARERGLSVDTAGFDKLMDEQRSRARAAQKKQVIELSEVETKTATHFLGYDHDHIGAEVQEVLSVKGKTVVIANNSVCYAEMGGQVGDTGEISRGGNFWRIANTQKSGNTWLHFLEGSDESYRTDKSSESDASQDAPTAGDHITITLDKPRRAAIQRHHTVTHLLHWALHEVVSHEASQKGSFVGPDKLTFDFNSGALTPQQLRDIEKLVNERIVENAGVAWTEVPYADVRGRADIMQFFGDKYGETVRVVDIGGYSKELCAGTHTRATGEIGLFRIVSEAAIAAGVRRIEAVAGLHAYESAVTDSHRLHALATRIGTPLPELEKRIEGMMAQQKELEKSLKAAQQREAAGRAKDLLASAETINGTPAIIAKIEGADGDTLQTIADALKTHSFDGVVVLGGNANASVALVAFVASGHTGRFQAGKIIQTIAPIVGGKGGGKPDNARGGGKDASQLDAALAKARELLG